MKKLVLAAVVAVLGVGSYVYQQSKEAKTGAILAQVPSDTLFLSYQTEAIDLGRLRCLYIWLTANEYSRNVC